MRTLLLLILSTLPLGAADINFSTSVTIVDDPNTAGVNEAQEAVAAVNAWRLTQFESDGETLKYPNNDALAAAMLEAKVQEVIRIVCNQGLPECPTAVQAQYDAAASAESAKATAIDDAIKIE